MVCCYFDFFFYIDTLITKQDSSLLFLVPFLAGYLLYCTQIDICFGT